jgi:glycine dehydrogenase subunit 1
MVAELFAPSPAPGEAAPYISNASMYDGASATAEGVLMARRVNGRAGAVLCGAVHPQYAETVECYLSGLCQPGEQLLHRVGLTDTGRVDLVALGQLLAASAPSLSCVVVQSPNYLGVVEDLRAIAELAHPLGVLVVAVCTEPLAMGLLSPPGALGADIICGEGLGLALPPSLGGPGVGLFAARAEYVRQMPGRLVGETVDQAGQRGYVLTLSTREQHIRREKATSNICTNHGLIALALTIHLSLLGRTGFVELAQLNLSKSEYAKQKLAALPGFSLAVSGPTFNEFALRLPGALSAEQVVEQLAAQGVLAGVPLDRTGLALPDFPGAARVLLIAVTERHRREDIDRLAQVLAEVCV